MRVDENFTLGLIGEVTWGGCVLAGNMVVERLWWLFGVNF